MRRVLILAAAAMVGAAGLVRAADLAAQITGSTPDNKVVPIYGKAYHTNPGAITLTPGGLYMTAYASVNLAGTVLEEGVDATPKDENWGSGGPAGQADGYGVRWEGYVNVPTAGTYTFGGGADDLLAVFVDGDQVYNQNDTARHPGSVLLSSGQHALSWQFGENGGGAIYAVSENIPGDDYTAASGHPFAGYSLEYLKTHPAPVTDALTMDVFSDTNFSVHASQRLFTGPVNMSWWGGWGAGPETWTPGSSALWGLGGLGDTWSTRLSGEMYFASAGTYTVTGGADDNVVLSADSDLDSAYEGIFNSGGGMPNSVTVAAAGWYPIRIEFRDTGGGQSFGVAVGGSSIGSSTWPVRSTVGVEEWIRFASGLTEVGSATTHGLLGSLDAVALGLARNASYDVRLRVLNTNVEQVIALGSVTVLPEPATAGLLALFAAALTLRRRRA